MAIRLEGKYSSLIRDIFIFCIKVVYQFHPLQNTYADIKEREERSLNMLEKVCITRRSSCDVLHKVHETAFVTSPKLQMVRLEKDRTALCKLLEL